jgi:hypothetical protein
MSNAYGETAAKKWLKDRPHSGFAIFSPFVIRFVGVSTVRFPFRLVRVDDTWKRMPRNRP